MKKLILFPIMCAILGGVLLFAVAKTEKPSEESIPLPSISPIASNPQPEADDQTVNIKASFTIITDGIVRSFKAAKYHNISSDVFITPDDPTKVFVTKKGIRWDDFFKTLPMKLTKECLTAGDGETFCDGKQGTLKFYLNDVEDENLLEKEIQDDSISLIKFTSY